MKKINGSIKPNGVKVGDLVELLEDFKTQDQSLFLRVGERGTVIAKEGSAFRVHMTGGTIVVFKKKVRKVSV